MCPFLPPEENGESVCIAAINAGQEEVIVEVRDPENASGSDMVSLTITPTEPPTAEILRPEDNGVFYSDYLITFEGVIGDSEDAVQMSSSPSLIPSMT